MRYSRTEPLFVFLGAIAAGVVVVVGTQVVQDALHWVLIVACVLFLFVVVAAITWALGRRRTLDRIAGAKAADLEPDALKEKLEEARQYFIERDVVAGGQVLFGLLRQFGALLFWLIAKYSIVRMVGIFAVVVAALLGSALVAKQNELLASQNNLVMAERELTLRQNRLMEGQLWVAEAARAGGLAPQVAKALSDVDIFLKQDRGELEANSLTLRLAGVLTCALNRAGYDRIRMRDVAAGTATTVTKSLADTLINDLDMTKGVVADPDVKQMIAAWFGSEEPTGHELRSDLYSTWDTLSAWAFLLPMVVSHGSLTVGQVLESLGKMSGHPPRYFLPSELCARIAVLSQSLRAYRPLQEDGSVGPLASPERSQILQFLLKSDAMIVNIAAFGSTFSHHKTELRQVRWKYLGGMDFSQGSFRGCRFWRCNFRGSNLLGCDLRDARFTRCDFADALLPDSSVIEPLAFIGCNLEGARVVGANWLASLQAKATSDPPPLEGFRQEILYPLSAQIYRLTKVR